MSILRVSAYCKRNPRMFAVFEKNLKLSTKYDRTFRHYSKCEKNPEYSIKLEGEGERVCFVSRTRIPMLVLKFLCGYLSRTRIRQVKRLSVHQIVSEHKQMSSYSVCDITGNEIKAFFACRNEFILLSFINII